LWRRSLCSLVKSLISFACEVCSLREKGLCFFYTALRLHGGKPPWFFHLRWYINSERRSSYGWKQMADTFIFYEAVMLKHNFIKEW
jgi:hypothetical protein